MNTKKISDVLFEAVKIMAENKLANPWCTARGLVKGKLVWFERFGDVDPNTGTRVFLGRFITCTCKDQWHCTQVSPSLRASTNVCVPETQQFVPRVHGVVKRFKRTG